MWDNCDHFFSQRLLLIEMRRSFLHSSLTVLPNSFKSVKVWTLIGLKQNTHTVDYPFWTYFQPSERWPYILTLKDIVPDVSLSILVQPNIVLKSSFEKEPYISAEPSVFQKAKCSVFSLYDSGHETKSMMNNSGPRYKRSQLEKRLNSDVLWCVVLLIVMCLTAAVGA